VHQLLLAIPFTLYGIYHIYYMTFVSFDYGYNMTVAVVTSFTHLVIWVIWYFKTDLE
jgi:hypothetical protein